MHRFFEHNEDFPQVDGTRTVLIGASIGANTAIIAASHDNTHVRGVVTISVGMDTKGLATTQPIYRYQNALLMLASQNDPVPFEATELLYRLAGGDKSIQLYKKLGHGTDMIRFSGEVQRVIVEWLVAHVPPTQVPFPPKATRTRTTNPTLKPEMIPKLPKPRRAKAFRALRR